MYAFSELMRRSISPLNVQCKVFFSHSWGSLTGSRGVPRSRLARPFHDRIRGVGRQNPTGRLADDVFVRNVSRSWMHFGIGFSGQALLRSTNQGRARAPLRGVEVQTFSGS